MKGCILTNKYKLFSIAAVFAVWWILSLVYPPLVVPKISGVFKNMIEILSSARMWTEIGRTITRMFQGLAVGIIIGSIAGLLGGIFDSFRQIYKPIQGIIQVVPPISWLILAIIWLGYNGRASIFIVVLAIMPTMAICIMDGIDGIDEKLVEMGRVFRFTKYKMFFSIYVPSVLPSFFSGLKISMGMAAKTVVMGEVLTTTTGIGGQISAARLNIEPESVVAWTVVVVLIYYVSVILGKLIMKAGRRIRNAGNKTFI